MGGRPPRRRAPRSRACTSAGPRRGRRRARCGRGVTRPPPRSSGHRCVRGEARRCRSAFRARPAARARRGARSTRRQTRGTRGRCRPPRLHSRARAPLACAARRGWPGRAPEPRAWRASGAVNQDAATIRGSSNPVSSLAQTMTTARPARRKASAASPRWPLSDRSVSPPSRAPEKATSTAIGGRSSSALRSAMMLGSPQSTARSAAGCAPRSSPSAPRSLPPPASTSARSTATERALRLRPHKPLRRRPPRRRRAVWLVARARRRSRCSGRGGRRARRRRATIPREDVDAHLLAQRLVQRVAREGLTASARVVLGAEESECHLDGVDCSSHRRRGEACAFPPQSTPVERRRHSVAVRAVGLVGENCDARLAARAVPRASAADARASSTVGTTATSGKAAELVVCAVLVRRSGPTHLLKGCDDDARARLPPESPSICCR